MVSLSRGFIAGAAIGCLFMAGVAQAATVTGHIKIQKKGEDALYESFENAIVYLEGIAQDPPTEPAISFQKNKQFEPRVLPVVKGQTVKFINQDALQHNVFSNDAGHTFDLGSFPKGDHREEVFETLGEQKVYCNIHQSMVQDIYVVPNRLFAVTDGKGSYSISDVPAGDYKLKVWHVHGGAHEQPLKVSGDAAVPDVTIQSTKVVRDIVSHKNKFGRRYRKSDY